MAFQQALALLLTLAHLRDERVEVRRTFNGARQIGDDAFYFVQFPLKFSDVGCDAPRSQPLEHHVDDLRHDTGVERVGLERRENGFIRVS